MLENIPAGQFLRKADNCFGILQSISPW